MTCIISFDDKEAIEKLQMLGCDCIPVIKSDKVSEPIASHADVLYLITDNKNIIVSSCQMENVHFLEEFGYKVAITDKLQPGYKTESYLNIIKCVDTLIYNPKTAINCEQINNVKDKIIVNQGYTRCSTIVIKENAFITEDEGIYNTLISSNKDRLLLTKGFVQLKGYDYGFIGGASVMLKNSVLFFNGDILDHPDKNKIIDFLKKHEIILQFIKNKPLTDIGGGIII